MQRCHHGEGLVDTKKPNLVKSGWATCTRALSLERPFQSKNPAGLLARGNAYSLRLPKTFRQVSVDHADFVPLTVAGQRWIYTIFPHRSRSCDVPEFSIRLLWFEHLMVSSGACQAQFWHALLAEAHLATRPPKSKLTATMNTNRKRKPQAKAWEDTVSISE
jgi:hypothetical protein